MSLYHHSLPLIQREAAFCSEKECLLAAIRYEVDAGARDRAAHATALSNRDAAAAAEKALLLQQHAEAEESFLVQRDALNGHIAGGTLDLGPVCSSKAGVVATSIRLHSSTLHCAALQHTAVLCSLLCAATPCYTVCFPRFHQLHDVDCVQQHDAVPLVPCCTSAPSPAPPPSLTP